MCLRVVSDPITPFRMFQCIDMQGGMEHYISNVFGVQVLVTMI